MKRPNLFSISWSAPIVPGVSLAGIPLNVGLAELEAVLANYLIDKSSSLYRFAESPDLRMARCDLDDCGNGGVSFSLFNEDMISEFKKGTPALSILIGGGRVNAVKAYDFSFPGEPANELVYKGVLPGGVGLGSLLTDILPFTSLEFDEAEEWFYTDQRYGVLEVSGWGVPLERQPEQIITAICITTIV